MAPTSRQIVSKDFRKDRSLANLQNKEVFDTTVSGNAALLWSMNNQINGSKFVGDRTGMLSRDDAFNETEFNGNFTLQGSKNPYLLNTKNKGDYALMGSENASLWKTESKGDYALKNSKYAKIISDKNFSGSNTFSNAEGLQCILNGKIEHLAIPKSGTVVVRELDDYKDEGGAAEVFAVKLGRKALKKEKTRRAKGQAPRVRLINPDYFNQMFHFGNLEERLEVARYYALPQTKPPAHSASGKKLGYTLATALFLGLAFAAPTPTYEKTASVTKHVLIVPGHDKEHPGCRGKAGNEEDLTLAIAKDLKSYFDKDPFFTTELARTDSGYSQPIQKLWKEQKEHLNSQAAQLLWSADQTQIDRYGKLLGLAEYVNETDPDLVVHVHINSHATNPDMKGFLAFYSSKNKEKDESEHFCSEIKNKLVTNFPIGSSDPTSSGIRSKRYVVLGSRHLEVERPSVLIEYGYINDTSIVSPEIQKKAASLTYQGIKTAFSTWAPKPAYTSNLTYNDSPVYKGINSRGMGH